MAEHKAVPVGGLTNKKLQLATATAADVLAGKTFYAQDREIKTGTRAAGAVIDNNFTAYPAASGEEFVTALEIPAEYTSCLVFASMFAIMSTASYIEIETISGTVTQLDSRSHSFTAGSYGGQHIDAVWLVEGVEGGATINVIGGGGGRHDLSCYAVGV